MIKAILFDMDGTLVDSERHYMQGTYNWMSRLGFKGKKEDLYQLIGLTMDVTHQKLKEMLNNQYSVEEVEKINYDYFMVEDPLPFGKLVFEDVEDVLKELKEMGYLIGLCSMSSKREINAFLSQSGLVFDVVVSGEDCTHNKPDPEIYLKALKSLKIEANEAIVVEDSKNGILAGKNAKIKTVGRKEPRFNVDQSDADHLFDDLNSFVVWLKENCHE